jgi:hypothetical protein
LQYPQKNKIPRNKLNKGCEKFYKEEYKPLKKNEEGYRRRNDLPCS